MGHLFLLTTYLEKNLVLKQIKGTVMYGKEKHKKIGLEFILDTILFVFIVANNSILLMPLSFILAIPWILLFFQGYNSFDK